MLHPFITTLNQDNGEPKEKPKIDRLSKKKRLKKTNKVKPITEYKFSGK